MIVGAVKPIYREIPIGLIDVPELPSRSSMDEEQLDELIASIRELGFISTIVVKQSGERFEVIAGHRRRLAAERAGLAAIPCFVYPTETEYLEAIQQTENTRREELNPADEAIWFAQLLEKYPNEGTDGIAARVREKRAYVEGRLALVSGDEDVFNAVAAGKIGIGVAQQLNRCTQVEFRRMFLDNALRHGATVAIVSGWIAEWKRDLEPATRAAFGSDAPSSAAPPVMDLFFTCGVCKSTAHPEQMRPVQVHEWCVHANLIPALELWNRRTDYLRRPRTFADAVELVNQLLEDWPDLAADAQAETGAPS